MKVFENPIYLSLSSIVLTFLIVFVYLYCSKPLFVTVMTTQGHRILSYRKIVLTALSLGLFIGIVVYVWKVEKFRENAPLVENTDDANREEIKEPQLPHVTY